jgi:hypothetical protein
MLGSGSTRWGVGAAKQSRRGTEAGPGGEKRGERGKIQKEE